MNHYALLIVGPTGCGKTTLLRKLVAKTNRALIYDSTGDWTGDRVCWKFPDYLAALRSRAGGKTVYRPLHFQDRTAFEHFCQAGFRYAYEMGGAALVCDEIAAYVSARSTSQYAQALFTRGRHYRLHPLTASQRPADLPGGLTANLTHFITFRQIHRTDEERVLAWYPSIEPVYRTLEQWEYVVWSRDGTSPHKGRVQKI